MKAKNSSNNDFYNERTQRNHFFLGGIEVQRKIKNLKIAIAGTGGMGSNIAVTLARIGVGELRIADLDDIDISNINRQVIATTKTVGKKKVDICKEQILDISPNIIVKSYDQGVQPEMVQEFVKDCDFIVDEIDIFPLEAHKVLHREVNKKNIPIYSAYVVGLGVHFYKFQGKSFTIEDFINYEKLDDKESIFEEVLKTFGSPLPEYLDQEQKEKFKESSLNKGVPIFGPSTLLGHSIVVTRIICDFLGNKILNNDIPKTPIMPKFLKIDLTTLSISEESFKK